MNKDTKHVKDSHFVGMPRCKVICKIIIHINPYVTIVTIIPIIIYYYRVIMAYIDVHATKGSKKVES